MTERELLQDILQSLSWATHRDAIRDPYYEARVEAVCEGVGYGALMDSAQRCWRRSAIASGDPPGGEHIAGPARATVERWLRLAAEMGIAPKDGPRGDVARIVDIAAHADRRGRG